jgi:uncharacterized membrane protein
MAGFFKAAGIVALIAAYALASHFALVLPHGRAVAAALAIGVPAVVLMTWAFQWLMQRFDRVCALRERVGIRFLLATTLAVLPLAAAIAFVWPMLLANAQMLYFVQHVGTNALLAWVFGHTLVGNATPLVVTFARRVHAELPPEIEAYARKVTLAWTLFFVVTCAISTVLFFAASVAAWSTFAVLLQWPSVAAFFVGEYVLRRRLFTQFEHASLKQGFDAYQQQQSNVSPVGVAKS